MTSRVQTQTDAELVESARAGDATAFGAIYDAYADPIHDFCASVLRDREEAADTTQDTFLIARHRLDALRDPCKLRPWLYAIARHECLRRARRRHRAVPTPELDLEADGDESPESFATRRDVQDLVWKAADGLSPRDRAVLQLNIRQGLDGQDLADALGVNRQHAYVLLANVRDRIDRSLGALLVARVGRDDCLELQALLSDWDGRLSPRLRKRIARHVDACETCGETRRKTVSPAALLSAAPLVAAPGILRDAVWGEEAAALSPGAEKTAASLGKGGQGTGFPPGVSVGSLPVIPAIVGGVVVAALIGGGAYLLFARSDSGSTVAGRDTATTGAPRTTTSPPTSEAQPATGAAESDYCAVVAEFDQAVWSHGPANSSPEAFQQYFETALSYLDRLVPIAPAEIQADAQALRDGVADLAAGGDMTASRPELEASKEAFDAFNFSYC